MKVAYEAFQLEHGLPDIRLWVELDEQVTPAYVRNALHEKLGSFCELLSQLVWPEGMNAVAEASALSEKEQEQAHKLFDALMLLEKDCLLAEIVSTPAEDIALIKTLCEEWPGIVTELRVLVAKTKGAYSGHRPGAHDLSYLG